MQRNPLNMCASFTATCAICLILAKSAISAPRRSPRVAPMYNLRKRPTQSCSIYVHLASCAAFPVWNCSFSTRRGHILKSHRLKPLQNAHAELLIDCGYSCRLIHTITFCTANWSELNSKVPLSDLRYLNAFIKYFTRWRAAWSERRAGGFDQQNAAWHSVTIHLDCCTRAMHFEILPCRGVWKFRL